MSGDRLLRVKIVLLGDGAVGKTSIAKRYLGESFSHDYISTIGVDFYVKKTFITLDGQKFEIQWSIWDLAGQPHWKEVRSGFYTGSKGALVVFDITRKNTLQNVIDWVNEFIKNSGAGPIILIGNKKDLRESCDNCVTKEEALDIAKRLTEITGYPVKYIETSALTGENINEAFEELGREILKQVLNQLNKK